MTGLSSCHNHTEFCDGKATARQMAAAALAAGFSDLGFSAHCDPLCAHLDEAAYLTALRALQAEYKGRLAIAVGVEQDYYTPVADPSRYDYILGSVHYVRGPATGQLWPMDWKPEAFRMGIEELGGAPALVKAYYANVAQHALRDRPAVTGHFDLVTKNNRDGAFFDEDAPWYRALALEALDGCLETDSIVEVNTGGMFRGYRERPYPARFVLERILERGGRVAVNADAHETAALTYGFAEARALLADVGFREIWALRDGRFAPEPLRPDETK